MGYPRPYVEIALEHSEAHDPQSLLDWIDNNQNRIEELTLAKTLEQSKKPSKDKKVS